MPAGVCDSVLTDRAFHFHSRSLVWAAMTARLNIVPDPGFMELKPVLVEKLERIASNIHAEEFSALLDPLMRQLLDQGFREAGADEGTVWLVDALGEHLVPAHNTGPRAKELVGKFKQPLSAGLVCMVFASEQPFVENEVCKNERQSKLLDSRLQQRTSAMIAVPFYFMRDCRGVISCVQLQTGESAKAGFQQPDLARVQRTATVVSRLIELRLLSQAVGWSCE